MGPDASLAVGRYRIVRSLGSGSRGDLYLAFDPTLNRDVALRVLPPMPADVRTRARRSLQDHAALHHRGLAPIHDVSDYDDRLVVVRAFVAGRTFAEIVAAKDPVPLDLRLEWIEHVCVALAHVHRHGRAGVALKCEDVVVGHDGDVVIVDAGLRELLEDAETLPRSTDSEPDRDPRRDIFFTGTLLCELLTFRRFVSASSEAEIFRLVGESLPRALSDAVERAVHRDPAYRYQTFEALASDLRRIRGAPGDPFESTEEHVPAAAPAAPSAEPAGDDESPRRRRIEIEALLAEAHHAFVRERLAEARSIAERVLLLDPDHERARALMHRTQALLEREAQQDELRRREESNATRRRVEEEARLGRERARALEQARASKDGRAARRTKVDHGAQPEPRPVDENVRFTVYRPAVMAPAQWYPLLFFTHLTERRPGAPDAEPDPATQVGHDAKRLLGAAISSYSRLAEDAALGIPHEALLQIRPSVPGLVFNPPEYSFLWLESVHRADFKVRADRSLEGRIARGTIDVRIGVIQVALITVAIPIETRAPAQEPPVQDIVQPYRRVFASYSHKDTAIVRQFQRYARGVGDSYMRDVIQLRAGEIWDQRLVEMIDAADVFQLFWSTNSMRSTYVRREWEHALTVNKPNFVRPLYWETPLPERDGLPPPELKARHFANVGLDEEVDEDEARSDADRTLSLPMEKRPVDVPIATEPPASSRSLVNRVTVSLLAVLLLPALFVLARC